MASHDQVYPDRWLGGLVTWLSMSPQHPDAAWDTDVPDVLRMLEQPGCVLCRICEEAARTWVHWFGMENHNDPALLRTLGESGCLPRAYPQAYRSDECPRPAPFAEIRAGRRNRACGADRRRAWRAKTPPAEGPGTMPAGPYARGGNRRNQAEPGWSADRGPGRRLVPDLPRGRPGAGPVPALAGPAVP